jgi:hypothetical protein
MEPPAKQAKNSADAVRSKVRGPGCLANGLAHFDALTATAVPQR